MVSPSSNEKRVDVLLVESEFGQLSGLVDPDKAFRLGKLLGANRIVLGTIADISEETKSFKGYGVTTENKVVTAELRVRVLAIETGNVEFSKTAKGSKSYSKSTYGELKSSDRHFAAVKAAVIEIAADDRFKAAIQGKKSVTKDRGVGVEFAPKPDNCDIEIDGKYVGGSPLKRKLTLGTEYRIRISKAGYKDWTGIIIPEVGLRIARELEANR